jgi:hypothetical protein
VIGASSGTYNRLCRIRRLRAGLCAGSNKPSTTKTAKNFVVFMKYSYLRGIEERNNVNSDKSILLSSACSATLNLGTGDVLDGLRFALPLQQNT